MPELRENEVASEDAIPDATRPVRRARRSERDLRAAPRTFGLGLRVWLPAVIALAAVAAIWEIYSHSHPYVIPSIGRIWQSLKDNPGMYSQDFLTTLREIAVGGAGGILVAFALATLMVELPILEPALMPLTVILMVTPIVAIAPALVVAFGFGVLPKYLATGIVVFYPMLINSLAGLRDVDGRALDVFRTLHASRWETFWRLRLPSSLPFIFAGLRIALPLSIVGATVAEFSAAGQQAGLGALIQVAASEPNLPVMWSAILLLCLLGLLLVAVLAVIRGRALFWQRASRTRR